MFASIWRMQASPPVCQARRPDMSRMTPPTAEARGRPDTASEIPRNVETAIVQTDGWTGVLSAAVPAKATGEPAEELSGAPIQGFESRCAGCHPA
jgi:hypothetical protein